MTVDGMPQFFYIYIYGCLSSHILPLSSLSVHTSMQDIFGQCTSNCLCVDKLDKEITCLIIMHKSYDMPSFRMQISEIMRTKMEEIS